MKTKITFIKHLIGIALIAVMLFGMSITALASGDTCEHQWSNGECVRCRIACYHTFANGTCAVCNITVSDTIKEDETKTVYVDKAYDLKIVEFIPEETGIYAAISTATGNVDPWTHIYFGQDWTFINTKDDGAEGNNFLCDFYAEAGKVCYIELYGNLADTEYDYTVKKYDGIIHQPSTKEPYVELSWNKEASYQ